MGHIKIHTDIEKIKAWGANLNRFDGKMSNENDEIVSIQNGRSSLIAHFFQIVPARKLLLN